MLINEVGKITELTKKAIKYYTFKGLISPNILENGYRVYNKNDIEQLNTISVLRKLGISTDEIRTILSDETKSTLQTIPVRKELSF